MLLVETLIAKAAEKQGSQAALARELGVHRAQITNWKNGTDKCQPADLAAIAYLAGYNALNVLAAATLKEYEGTQKGKVLEAALGKEIQALGCLNASGLTPLKGGLADLYNVALCIQKITNRIRAGRCTRARGASFAALAATLAVRASLALGLRRRLGAARGCALCAGGNALGLAASPSYRV